ncbi:MAG: HAD hydrolase-like protein [Bacillota bacterium]|nr:HAD hydrolase-like protein [Bacillota bacterium]
MIKTMLFDVDGVLLSEEHYFDASALTVWELLYSNNYLGLQPQKFSTEYTSSEITAIREQVFQEDAVLKFLKSRGLNANWDMIYLTFSYQLIHLLSQIKEVESEHIKKWLGIQITRETLLEIGNTLKKHKVTVEFHLFLEDFHQSVGMKQSLFDYLDTLAKEKLGIETTVFRQKGTLWSVCEHISQEWYVGDENVFASTGRPSVQLGKKGFLANEETLRSKSEISELFEFLLNAGISIGIGTGRPALETIEPFKHLNWLRYFEENHIVTADEVLKAQNEYTSKKSLSKPHPYTYIQALYGKDYPIQDCLQKHLPIESAKEVLIVGDSLADLLAAREMGATFAAVLTGLSGQNARSEFEKYQADYILDSVLDVKNLVESIY